MRYRIESSAGVDLGTYVGASPREAIEAMWLDAGAPKSERERDEAISELTLRAVAPDEDHDDRAGSW